MESIQKSAHEAALRTTSDREALREYHYRRCGQITNYDFVDEGEPVVVLHIAVPSAVMNQEKRIDTSSFVEDRTESSLLGGVHHNYRFNARARSAEATRQSQKETSTSHTIHETGIVEAVSTGVFGQKGPDDPPSLRTETLEISLVSSVADTVQIFEEKGIETPVFATASYLNVDGIEILRGIRTPHNSSIKTENIDTDITEVYLQQHPRYELDSVLQPVWSAAKFTSSDYIDNDEWTLDLD